MKDDLGLGKANDGADGIRITQIDQTGTLERVVADYAEQAGTICRSQRETGDFGSQMSEPDRQPAAFESRVARDKHTPARINIAEGAYHVFHGA